MPIDTKFQVDHALDLRMHPGGRIVGSRLKAGSGVPKCEGNIEKYDGTVVRGLMPATARQTHEQGAGPLVGSSSAGTGKKCGTSQHKTCDRMNKRAQECYTCSTAIGG